MPSPLAGRNVLLAATGSVAAIRVPALARLLLCHGAAVRLVATNAAMQFLPAEQALPPGLLVYTGEDEWRLWDAVGDPVLHIDLVKWAHALVIAPLSANSLAKLAAGICDNLVLCIARAWPFSPAKPFLVAPAMNVHMWTHPLTPRHLDTIRAWPVSVVLPVEKRLACGDVGMGAMQSPEHITSHLIQMLPPFAIESVPPTLPPPSSPSSPPSLHSSTLPANSSQ